MFEKRHTISGDVDMGSENEIEEIVDLYSLGIDPRRKNDLNDKQELAELAENIKQSMYHDYKTAFGREGDRHEEEAKSTVGAGARMNMRSRF